MAGVVPIGWEGEGGWATGAEAPPLSPVIELVVPAVIVWDAMFGERVVGMGVKQIRVFTGSSASELVSVVSESASSSSVTS